MNLLDAILDLQQNYSQDTMDVFIRCIDDMCWESRFEEIDDAISKIDLSKGGTSGFLRTVLCLTACIKNKLKNRSLLYDASYVKMIELVGQVKTDRLLGRLK